MTKTNKGLIVCHRSSIGARNISYDEGEQLEFCILEIQASYNQIRTSQQSNKASSDPKQTLPGV